MGDPVGWLRSWLRATARTIPLLRTVLLAVYKLVERHMWSMRRLVSGTRPIEIESRCGPVYMVPEGHIAEAVWRSGFEEAERGFVERFLQPGNCLLNVGANSGLYTLLAGKIVGPTGEVHAFEPASENVDRLRRNVALNGFMNVTVNQCAVADTPGIVDLCRDPIHPTLDSHYCVRAAGEARGELIERIQSISLDEYWLRHCSGTLRAVDMIIIDVEGAELQVFKGAKSLLTASPEVIIMAECTDGLGEIARFLRAIGFSFHVWDSSTGRLIPTEVNRGNMFICRERSPRLQVR